MKRILFILTGCALMNNVRSQDFHLSMYDAAPLFLNPSMTGVIEGDWRIHAQCRTQWRAVNFKPYNTALLSFDAPVGKWGFGAQIIEARAGVGNYNALQGTANIAYTVPLSKNKAHNLSFGVQGGVTQKSVEYKLYTFGNQYVTTNGGGFDQSLNSNETFASQSIMLPVVNAGLMYYYAKQQSKLNPFLGFSAFNLIEPKETFFMANNKWPMRFYAHTGVRVNITETIYLLPKVLVMQQGNATEQTFAVDGGFYFKHSQLYFLAGLIYRTKDASIVSLGARKNSYIAKVSYDFNMSTLTPNSDGRGGLEISFTYIHQKEKPKGHKICPRL
ncbi:MAG TPA: PorP/SprF family type IX secretion system membrane protein [Flavobacteriales bacterium]|nr:PorP/SprF family type IX secretion system membrane protein [Flavobacteriales bacterium]